MTNVRKRRRLNVDFEELKKAGAAESTVLADAGADDGSENDFIWHR